MKIPWGDLAFTAITGALIRRFLSGTPDLPPPAARETFAPQPMSVYIERVVWALTTDFDIVRIRRVRNFVSQHEPLLADGHRTETPPEEMARRVEQLMRDPNLAAGLSEESRIRSLFGPPPAALGGVGVVAPATPDALDGDPSID